MKYYYISIYYSSPNFRFVLVFVCQRKLFHTTHIYVCMNVYVMSSNGCYRQFKDYNWCVPYICAFVIFYMICRPFLPKLFLTGLLRTPSLGQFLPETIPRRTFSRRKFSRFWIVVLYMDIMPQCRDECYKQSKLRYFSTRNCLCGNYLCEKLSNEKLSDDELSQLGIVLWGLCE